MLIPTKQERKVASHFSAEFSLENEHFWNSTKHWGLSYWFYSFLFQSRILTEAQRKQLTFKYVPEIPPILELKKKKAHICLQRDFCWEKKLVYFSLFVTMDIWIKIVYFYWNHLLLLWGKKKKKVAICLQVCPSSSKKLHTPQRPWWFESGTFGANTWERSCLNRNILTRKNKYTLIICR